MAYTVALPDGRTVEFPDDLPKDKAAAVIRQQFPEFGAPKTTALGQVKEAFKGFLPGAVNLVESAATGASALLPEDMEKSAREKIKSVATAAKAPFEANAGYENSVGRRIGEGLGSMLPAVPLALMGAPGIAAGVGLGLASGAGEARTRAEGEGATAEQRGKATALGAIPGGFDTAIDMALAALPGGVGKSLSIVRRALVSGGVEGATEAAQAIAQNAIAKGVYKPDQALLEGSGEEGAYGAGVGAIASVLLDMAIPGRRAKSAQAPTPPAAAEAPTPPTTPPTTPPAGPETLALPAPTETLALPNAPTPTSVANAIQERERLKSRPQTADITARVAALDELIANYNQWDIEATRDEQAQQQADAERVAAEDAEVRRRFPNLAGETGPSEEVVAPEETPAAPGALTMQNILDTGVPLRVGMDKWFEANVIGKTLPELQALTKRQPELVKGQTPRAKILRELLAPQPTKFEEAPSVLPTPTPQPAPESRPEPGPSEPSVGVPSEPVPEPTPAGDGAPGAPVAPDGVGLAPAGQPAVSRDEAQGAEPAAISSDQIHAQIRDLMDQRAALLDKAGRAPRDGTAKAAQWDALDDQIGRLKSEWAAADRAERASKPKPTAVHPRMADRIEAVEERDEAREQVEYAAQRADMVAAFKAKHDRNIKAAWAAVQRARQDLKTVTPRSSIAASEIDRSISTLEDTAYRYDQFVNEENADQKVLDQFEKTVSEIPTLISNLRAEIDSAAAESAPKVEPKLTPKAVRENLQAILDDPTASKRSKQTAFKALDSLDDPDLNETAEDRAQNEAYAAKELQSAEKQRRFSTTDKGDTGRTVDDLRGEIDAATGPVADALRRMVKSGKVKLEAAHPEGGKRGMFDGKTVTLYAEGIPEGQALAVALHEVGAHMGMAKLLGQQQYNAVVDKILEWVSKGGDSQQAKLAQRAWRRIPAEDIDNADASVARDELVAYFVEELATAEAKGQLPKLGPLRVLWNQIKTAITTSVNKALGTSFGVNGLTPQQIGAIAEAAMVRESQTGVDESADIKRQFSVSAGAQTVIDSMGDFDAPTKSRLTQLIEGWKANPELGYVTKFRVLVADSAAALDHRFRNKFDGAVRDALGKVNPMGLFRQAQDHAKMLLEYFQQGTMAKDPATGQWYVTTDKKVRPPVAVYELLDKWAAKNGYTREQATKNASRILEGVRLDAMRTSNDVDGTNFALHLKYPQIDILLREYKADPDLQEMSKLMDEARVEMVKHMVAVGRLTPETGKVWAETIGYVPFDRLDDEKFTAAYSKVKKISNKGIAQVGKLPELVGSVERPVGNVFENYLNTLGWMVGQTMKTDATVRTLRALEDIQQAKYLGPSDQKNPNAVGMYVQGEMRYWEVQSKYDVMAFKDLTVPKANWIRAMGQFSNFLRRAVTVLPPFALKQVTDDVQRAIMTSGVKNPGALLRMTLTNFPKLAMAELRGIQHPDVRRFGAVGLTGEYDFEAGKPATSLLKDLGYKPRGKFETLMHRLDGITRASDLAVRAAIYDQTMKESNNDVLLAQTRAREFINFRRRGSSQIVGDLVTVIPFFNAYIQGMDVLYRAASGKDSSASVGRAQARRFFWSRAVTATMLASLYALSKDDDDEDYKNMDLRTRDGNWILPGGVKLPVPGELGAIFKVIPERVVEYMKRQGTPEEQTAWEATRTALSYIYEQYLGRTTPVPQAVKPLIEAWANKSFLTGRALEGFHHQSMDPSERRTEQTTELAMAIANFSRDVVGVQVSPIMIDNTLRGYFGSTAALVTAVTDSMLNPTRVDRPLHKWALLSNYMYDPVGTRAMTEFYEEREKVGKAGATLRELMKTDMERAASYAEEHADELQLESAVNATLQNLENTRAYRKFLNSPDGAKQMSTEEREADLKEIKQLELQYVSWLREAKTAMRSQ